MNRGRSSSPFAGSVTDCTEESLAELSSPLSSLSATQQQRYNQFTGGLQGSAGDVAAFVHAQALAHALTDLEGEASEDPGDESWRGDLPSYNRELSSGSGGPHLSSRGSSDVNMGSMGESGPEPGARPLYPMAPQRSAYSVRSLLFRSRNRGGVTAGEPQRRAASFTVLSSPTAGGGGGSGGASGGERASPTTQGSGGGAGGYLSSPSSASSASSSRFFGGRRFLGGGGSGQTPSSPHPRANAPVVHIGHLDTEFGPGASVGSGASLPSPTSVASTHSGASGFGFGGVRGVAGSGDHGTPPGTPTSTGPPHPRGSGRLLNVFNRLTGWASRKVVDGPGGDAESSIDSVGGPASLSPLSSTGGGRAGNVALRCDTTPYRASCPPGGYSGLEPSPDSLASPGPGSGGSGGSDGHGALGHGGLGPGHGPLGPHGGLGSMPPVNAWASPQHRRHMMFASPSSAGVSTGSDSEREAPSPRVGLPLVHAGVGVGHTHSHAHHSHAHSTGIASAVSSLSAGASVGSDSFRVSLGSGASGSLDASVDSSDAGPPRQRRPSSGRSSGGGTGGLGSPSMGPYGDGSGARHGSRSGGWGGRGGTSGVAVTVGGSFPSALADPPLIRPSSPALGNPRRAGDVHLPALSSLRASTTGPLAGEVTAEDVDF